MLYTKMVLTNTKNQWPASKSSSSNRHPHPSKSIHSAIKTTSIAPAKNLHRTQHKEIEKRRRNRQKNLFTSIENVVPSIKEHNRTCRRNLAKIDVLAETTKYVNKLKVSQLEFLSDDEHRLFLEQMGANLFIVNQKTLENYYTDFFVNGSDSKQVDLDNSINNMREELEKADTSNSGHDPKDMSKIYSYFYQYFHHSEYERLKKYVRTANSDSQFYSFDDDNLAGNVPGTTATTLTMPQHSQQAQNISVPQSNKNNSMFMPPPYPVEQMPYNPNQMNQMQPVENMYFSNPQQMVYSHISSNQDYNNPYFSNLNQQQISPQLPQNQNNLNTPNNTFTYDRPSTSKNSRNNSGATNTNINNSPPKGNSLLISNKRLTKQAMELPSTQKMGPKDLQSVTLSGTVIDDKELIENLNNNLKEMKCRLSKQMMDDGGSTSKSRQISGSSNNDNNYNMANHQFSDGAPIPPVSSDQCQLQSQTSNDQQMAEDLKTYNLQHLLEETNQNKSLFLCLVKKMQNKRTSRPPLASDSYYDNILPISMICDRSLNVSKITSGKVDNGRFARHLPWDSDFGQMNMDVIGFGVFKLKKISMRKNECTIWQKPLNLPPYPHSSISLTPLQRHQKLRCFLHKNLNKNKTTIQSRIPNPQ